MDSQRSRPPWGLPCLPKPQRTKDPFGQGTRILKQRYFARQLDLFQKHGKHPGRKGKPTKTRKKG